jgi:hypothetical protein
MIAAKLASPSVISDAAGVLAARAAGRAAMRQAPLPSLASAGTTYGTAVLYDGFVGPIIDGQVLAATNEMVHLAAKTAAFSASEMLLARLTGARGGMSAANMARDFLLTGAGIWAGQRLIKPMIAPRSGVAPAMQAAAQARPLEVR